MNYLLVIAIVNAIFLAEGSNRTQYLYGIKSVPYYSKAEAKQICINTVQNNYSRWIVSGQKEDYLIFLSKRYCPTDSETWYRNVNYLLRKEFKDENLLKTIRGSKRN